MAIKHMKDQIINVRATDKTKSMLLDLCKILNLNQSDVIDLALKELFDSKK